MLGRDDSLSVTFSSRDDRASKDGLFYPCANLSDYNLPGKLQNSRARPKTRTKEVKIEYDDRSADNFLSDNTTPVRVKEE